MESVDLNLLVALDALLVDGSVTAAARRLDLSPSAMSRTLARLRAATGDPLLVRAGRGLVLTPHAAALRGRVHALTQDARAMLRPASEDLNPASLAMTFTLRVTESFMERLSIPVAAAVEAAAPGVCLRFVSRPDEDPGPHRDGVIDLEIGELGMIAPEMHTSVLFRDTLVGVVRVGHPLLEGAVTPERYAACRHVVASQRIHFAGPVDDALAALGLKRTIAVVVPGYPDAIRMVRSSDLVALMPRSCLGARTAGKSLKERDVQPFTLPVSMPGVVVSAIWHPRMDNDPAHRWLRALVTQICAAAYPQK